MKTVEITVSPNGETNVETKGFSGSECQKASEFLTKALGRKAGEQLKPEYHENTSGENEVRNEM